MPELPEVQTTVNGIKENLVGLLIEDAWTDYKSAHHIGKDNIKDPAYFAHFRKDILGAKITGSSRRGKNVLIHLSNGKTILIHMKMTGHVMYGKYKLGKNAKGRKEWTATEAGPLRDDPFNKFLHFVLAFSNGKHMVLSDMRKFAKVTLVDTDKIAESLHLSAHGPEPLEKSFDVRALKAAVSKRPKGRIKAVLMDHQIISGIGNIYSDEILWRAGIHPLQKIKEVPNEKWPPIWKAMKETLNKGIDFGGDSMSDYRNIHGERGKFQEKHNAYRKTGKRCAKPGCGGTIVRIKVGGRSAHFCDTHQKLIL
ncbi:MAG TPA: bifunctional DNA-formamidopyrimidine glycosylase/DNA-(apurinic or apyrimidinic site) lyase [Candidatus Paceibacterota bacterium]|nr:bifunctional DNA-formamidopyrimidine glycosylase/DNA-(apurinic or apyrimidinic site) lyase [Candidatus Paceibacterota bacterium]